MVALHGVPPAHQYTGGGDWIMDTGVSFHIANHLGILTSSSPRPLHTSIIIGNGAPLPVSQFGSSVITTFSTPLHLNNVLISSHLIKNLISVHALTCDSYVSVTFDTFGFSIMDFRTWMILLRCDSIGELYPLHSSSNKATASSRSFLASHSTELWHVQLGHPGHGQLHRLLSTFDFTCVKGDDHSRSTYRVSKQARLPFSESSNISLFPFHLLHCDVWTSPVVSNSGFKFYLMILDALSHFTWTFPLRQTSDVLPTLIAFHAFVHTQFHRLVICIQNDNGREFDNHTTHSFLFSYNIVLCLTCPYTSQQNGYRSPQTLNDNMHTMLLQATLAPTFWLNALATATYLLNRHPCPVRQNTTPFELLLGHLPGYTHLRFATLTPQPPPRTSLLLTALPVSSLVTQLKPKGTGAIT
jgi:hypothetical protein